MEAIILCVMILSSLPQVPTPPSAALMITRSPPRAPHLCVSPSAPLLIRALWRHPWGLPRAQLAPLRTSRFDIPCSTSWVLEHYFGLRSGSMPRAIHTTSCDSTPNHKSRAQGALSAKNHLRQTSAPPHLPAAQPKGFPSRVLRPGVHTPCANRQAPWGYPVRAESAVNFLSPTMSCCAADCVD